MKILFLNPDRSHTCSFYRSGGIVNNLRKQLGANFTVDVISWPDLPTDWQMISNYDIIMMQRPYTSQMLDYAVHVKQMRVKLWLDFDDNLFTVAPENRAWPVFNDPNIQTYIKQLIALADVVSVTTEDLKQFYLPLNKNIVVIPNAFNDTIFRVDRVVHERENIVAWRGSDTHIYDLMAYAPAITKCTTDFPEYEFTYIGYNPWFFPAAKNIAFEKARDIVDYFSNLFNLKPAVVQVPLFDSNFNRCKSNIAFIEGAYVGAVCIIPEFWGKIPGTLSYNDKESYYEALRSVLAGEVDIKAMNEVAWQYVKDNLLLSKVNKLRVKLIKNLLKDVKV